MYRRKKDKNDLSPLADWILAYVRNQEISISELSRRASLSPGALRSLIAYPDRIPNLETCLKLADATQTPVNDVFKLAGIPSTGEIPESLHPDHVELSQRFDALSPGLRRAMLEFARTLSDIVEKRA